MENMPRGVPRNDMSFRGFFFFGSLLFYLADMDVKILPLLHYMKVVAT